MTNLARVLAGLACCCVVQVVLALVWAVLVRAGRAGWDQDAGDG